MNYTKKDLNKLELILIGKLAAIKRKEITSKECGFGKILNAIKPLDEALYEQYLQLYKNTINETK